VAENLGRGLASGPEMNDAENGTCRKGTERELQPLDLGRKKLSERWCLVKRREETTVDVELRGITKGPEGSAVGVPHGARRAVLTGTECAAPRYRYWVDGRSRALLTARCRRLTENVGI
jgi:hypothetical protein